MPIYEYECKQCEQVIEVMQKFSDDPLSQCPQCGGSVRKLISRSSFHLKGSGWYKTDYKKSDASASSKGSEASSSSENSKGASDKKDASSSSTDKGGEKSKEASSSNKS